MDKQFCDIYELLYELGIYAKYTGFFQTVCAVELCREDPERLQLITKRLYPEVARQHRTTWRAVERNIRTACGVAWQNNRNLLEQLGRRPFPRKPCNAHFLAILLYSLRMRGPSPGETARLRIAEPNAQGWRDSGRGSYFCEIESPTIHHISIDRPNEN